MITKDRKLTMKYDRASLRWSRSKMMIIILCLVSLVFYNRLRLLSEDRITNAILDAMDSNKIHWRSEKLQKGSGSDKSIGWSRNRGNGAGKKPLTIHEDLNDECRLKWIKNGELCQGKRMPSIMPVDLVWTWQCQSNFELALAHLELNSSLSTLHQLFENDLIKYSFRSAQKNVGQGFGEIALLTSDVLSEPEALRPLTLEPKENFNRTRNSSIGKSFDLLYRLRSLMRNEISQKNTAKHVVKKQKVELESKRKKDLEIVDHQYFIDEANQKRKVILPEWFRQRPDERAINIQSLWNVARANVQDVSRFMTSDRKEASTWQSFLRSKKTESLADKSAWTTIASYAFKQQRFPTFNPNVVKQIASEYNAQNDVFILIRPTQFFESEFSSSDFYSPLYGPIFRFSQEGVDELKAEEGKRIESSAHHSLFAMEKANSLIGARFGHRGRRKVLDVPTVMVRDLLDEMNQSWKLELRRSSLNKVPTTGDIDSTFLYVHFVIERFREALLWSFFVARHDLKGTNEYSRRSLIQLLSELGVSQDFLYSTDGKGHQIYFSTINRSIESINEESNYFQQHKLKKTVLPKLDDITLTSQEGYLGNFDSLKQESPVQERRPACKLLKQCFLPVTNALKEGKPILADKLFKHMSFSQWGCGDCVITHLLGSPGLSAFLPAKDLQLPSASKHSPGPKDIKLPSNARFEELDFSLSNVAAQSASGTSNRLQYVTSLLLRYQHAISLQNQEQSLIRLGERNSVKGKLLEFENDPVKLFTIRNDDQNSYQYNKRTLFPWLDVKFPESTRFED